MQPRHQNAKRRYKSLEIKDAESAPVVGVSTSKRYPKRESTKQASHRPNSVASSEMSFDEDSKHLQTPKKRELKKLQKQKSTAVNYPTDQEPDFEVGQIVWVQISGFDIWPGRIIKQEQEKGVKKYQCEHFNHPQPSGLLGKGPGKVNNREKLKQGIYDFKRWFEYCSQLIELKPYESRMLVKKQDIQLATIMALAQSDSKLDSEKQKYKVQEYIRSKPNPVTKTDDSISSKKVEKKQNQTKVNCKTHEKKKLENKEEIKSELHEKNKKLSSKPQQDNSNHKLLDSVLQEKKQELIPFFRKQIVKQIQQMQNEFQSKEFQKQEKEQPILTTRKLKKNNFQSKQDLQKQSEELNLNQRVETLNSPIVLNRKYKVKDEDSLLGNLSSRSYEDDDRMVLDLLLEDLKHPDIPQQQTNVIQQEIQDNGVVYLSNTAYEQTSFNKIETNLPSEVVIPSNICEGEVSEQSSLQYNLKYERSAITIYSDVSCIQAQNSIPLHISPNLRYIVEEAIKILRVDKERLIRQNSWYNDSIINFITEIMCTNVVTREDKPPKRPKVLNTHFFNCLMGIENFRADRILMKNIDKKSPCIVPIHRENHWTCALIFIPTTDRNLEILKQKSPTTSIQKAPVQSKLNFYKPTASETQIYFLDSLSMQLNKEEIETLQLCAKYNYGESYSSKITQKFRSLPQQNDGNDCGVFALEFMIRAHLNFPSFVKQIKESDEQRPPLFTTSLIKKRRGQYYQLIKDVAEAKNDTDLINFVRTFKNNFV